MTTYYAADRIFTGESGDDVGRPRRLLHVDRRCGESRSVRREPDHAGAGDHCVEQALLLNTGRARRLLDLPGLGAIAAGNEASLVTLSQDVFSVEPKALFDTTITGTWIAGERVFG